MLAELAPAPDLAFAEALTTRLCHDMAGLAATLSGTLEMVLEEQGAESEAGALATEAARGIAARLRLYRAAWGGGDMAQMTLASLAEGLPNRPRLRLELNTLEEARAAGGLDEAAARLALALLLVAALSLPAGGTVRAAPEHGGFAMTLEGRNAGWPAALTDGARSADPKTLAVPVAAMLATGMGWRLDVAGAMLKARTVGGMLPLAATGARELQ